MTFTRRSFGQALMAQACLASALPLTACGSKTASNSETPRRYVINSNLVFGTNVHDPLSETAKNDFAATNLTAFKMSLGGSQGTYKDTMEQLDWLPIIFETNPDHFMRINSAADLDTAYDTKKIGVIYSFEAATMFDGKIDPITEFANRGVKIMQLGYNHTSPYGAGVLSTTGPLGLSALGKQAVEAMEASNVLIDLSHAHECTTSDVLSMATQPAAQTHTGCYGVNPHPRNKSDEALKAIAQSGGVTGIYAMSYLTPTLEQQSLEAFMAHILHAVKVSGEDHVGIGSDSPILGFDTSPESLAQWDAINEHRKKTGVAAPGEGPPPYIVGLNGPRRMPRIAEELAKRGIKPAAIDKIMGQNFARVFKDAWGG